MARVARRVLPSERMVMDQCRATNAPNKVNVWSQVDRRGKTPLFHDDCPKSVVNDGDFMVPDLTQLGFFGSDYVVERHGFLPPLVGSLLLP